MAAFFFLYFIDNLQWKWREFASDEQRLLPNWHLSQILNGSYLIPAAHFSHFFQMDVLLLPLSVALSLFLFRRMENASEAYEGRMKE